LCAVADVAVVAAVAVAVEGRGNVGLDRCAPAIGVEERASEAACGRRGLWRQLVSRN
jgi:hypothetical protein